MSEGSMTVHRCGCPRGRVGFAADASRAPAWERRAGERAQLSKEA